MLKSILHTIGSRVFSAILNFSTIIILSRFLGAEGKGFSALFITQVSFIVILTEFVGGSTLVYLVPRYDLRSLLMPVFTWTIFITLIYTLISSHFNLSGARQITFWQLLMAGLTVSTYSVLQKILSAFERFEILSLLNAFQASVLTGLLLMFFLVGKLYEPSAYSYALIISYLLSILIAITELVKNNPQNDLPRASLKDLVKLGFINQIAHVFHLLSARLAFWLLVKNCGAYTTGVFSNAVQLAEAVWVITNSFATVQYAKISNQTQIEESKMLTNLLGRITFLITSSILILVNAMPGKFFTTLFGNDFVNLKQPLLILSLGSVFFNWMLIYGHYFSGRGIYKHNTFSVLISSVFVIVGFLILNKNLNLLSAAALTAMSYFISGLSILLIYLRNTKQNYAILIPRISDFKELKKLL